MECDRRRLQNVWEFSARETVFGEVLIICAESSVPLQQKNGVKLDFQCILLLTYGFRQEYFRVQKSNFLKVWINIFQQ